MGDFLSGRGLCKRVERVLHYGRVAAGHRKRAIQPWVEGFEEFRRGFNEDAFGESVPKVLAVARWLPLRIAGRRVVGISA